MKINTWWSVTQVVVAEKKINSLHSLVLHVSLWYHYAVGVEDITSLMAYMMLLYNIMVIYSKPKTDTKRTCGQVSLNILVCFLKVYWILLVVCRVTFLVYLTAANSLLSSRLFDLLLSYSSQTPWAAWVTSTIYVSFKYFFLEYSWIPPQKNSSINRHIINRQFYPGGFCSSTASFQYVRWVTYKFVKLS